MNLKRCVWILLACLLLAPFSLAQAADKLIMLDKTDTTDDWIINTDLAATGFLYIVDGPEKGWKAVLLKYDLTGGKWVNLGKEYRKNMENAKALVFYLKGKGLYTLEIKIADLSGTTYGIKIAGGTEVSEWKRVVLPLNSMTYLWGGSSKVLDLKNIRGIDFAASAEEGGGPGDFYLSHIEYSTENLQADLPKAKGLPQPASASVPPGGPKSKDRVEIGSSSDWRSFPDKGAAIKLAFIDGPEKNMPALQASFTWGQREIPGLQEKTGNWVALNRDINMDLSEMRNVVMRVKSTGSIANLEVKLIDKDNTTYGYIIPGGSSVHSWTRVAVSRKDFNYMWGGDGTGRFDWSSVARIEFALSRTNDSRDTGAFAVSDIRMESAVTVPAGAKPAEEKGEEYNAPGRIKVMIDDFTDLNPANRYYVITGDDSTLSLSSSRIVFEGNYSMSMKYQLITTRPNGSWVEAQRRFNPPLNWTGVEEIKMWVRGDASQNIFRFTLTDGNGNIWFADNTKVLTATEWYLVNFPVESFKLFPGQKEVQDQTLKTQLQSISQMSIRILSQPDITSNKQGEIFIENFYVIGRGITPARAQPLVPRELTGLALPLKNWNIGGTSNTSLNNLPNTGTTATQNLALKITGNFEKFSVLGEIRLDSTYGNGEDLLRSQDATLAGPNLAVTVLDPLPGINNVIIGNLYFAGSPNIFANDNLYGGFGFKGMLVEGWIGKLNHHTYFIKHSPDSYTVAGQYDLTLNDLVASLSGTYYNNQPFIASATRLLDDDKALLLDVIKKFKWPDVIEMYIRAQAGYDWYQKYFDTSTQTKIDQRLAGAFLQGEFNFSDLSSILWPGISLTGIYRYVDKDYKPTFRQSPGFWDVEYGDQKGYQARLYQSVLGAYFSTEYSNIERLSNPDQYRERTRFSVGYYNGSSIDITLSQEFANKFYNFEDTRYILDGKPALLFEDWEEANTEFYVAYHFGGDFQISEKLTFQNITRKDFDAKYSQMFTLTRVLYYPAPNITFSLENKFSRYGREVDVPVINPADPFSFYDYTFIKVDLTF